MKLSQAKVKVITAASAAALETAVNTFLEAAKEGVFIDIQYQFVAGEYTACIVYTKS